MNSLGESTAIKRPASINAMREPRRKASRRSCVTKTTVLFRSLLQGEKFALQLRARQSVERSERFVHEQDRRICSQSPRDADSLPLPA